MKGAFGADVAIDGDTILVGEPGDPRGPDNYSGGAYVFVRNGESWELEAELDVDAWPDSVGGVVALQGDTALVATGTGRFDSGSVSVHERSGGVWKRTGALGGYQNHDFFGVSLAMSGRNLVVGAPSERGGAGGVFLFRRNGPSYDKFLLYLDESSSWLGHEVAADGDAIIAGAPQTFRDGSSQGAGGMFLLDFPATLHAPVAQLSEGKFRFQLAEADPGATYILETKSSLDLPDWTTVNEVQAESSEVQVETELSLESPAGFYRLRLKE